MFSQPLEETGAFFVARFFSLISSPLERLFLIITTHLREQAPFNKQKISSTIDFPEANHGFLG